MVGAAKEVQGRSRGNLGNLGYRELMGARVGWLGKGGCAGGRTLRACGLEGLWAEEGHVTRSPWLRACGCKSSQAVAEAERKVS